MIIKNLSSFSTKNEDTLAGFFQPDQFVTEKQRNQEWYIKKTMDYFANVAFAQLATKGNIKRNYKLRNGEFDFNDYVDSPEIQQIDKILGSMSENEYSYLRHYPIINPPLNTLKGELVGRPRKERVKADDDMTKSEILSYRTETLFQAIIEKLQAKFQPNEEGELPEEYYKQLQGNLVNYTTEAEQWGNKALKVFKSHFNFSALNEDGFMDFLTVGKEFHHLYPDNSKFGFNYEVLNPKNVWWIASADNTRTTSDCWAVGTIRLKSITKLIDEHKLTKEEVKQLTTNEIESNGSLDYTTQTPSLPNPALLNFGFSNSYLEDLADVGMYDSFGTQQYHVEVRSYWKGKKKIFTRTFLDEEGYQRTEFVDETYKFDEDYGDISLEEEWINQWYSSVRIGPYIYKEIEELEFNDTSPIIGIINHTKNTEGKSLIDLMKGYQAIYNICINQVWDLLSKEIGVVFLGDLKLVPKKDSDNPVETMLWEARERGAIFVDSSMENTGGNVQFNQLTAINLTRSVEIQTRLQIAEAVQNYCWELVGISRQRTGSVMASESATGTNTALSQSYAQTEIWFKFHEDLMREVLQSALNIMQWVALKKPESVLNYLNSELDNVFFKINRAELLRNLNVNVTSAKEDKDLVESLKQLMQPAMQNGADLLEMAEILSANSENKLKDILKGIQERKDDQLKQAQEMEQQKIQQSQEQFKIQQELIQQQHEELIANENANKEADRQNKIAVATIQAIGFEKNEESNTGDIESASKTALEQSRQNFEQLIKIKELSQKDRELSLKDKDIDTKLKIAQENRTKAEMTKKKAKK